MSTSAPGAAAPAAPAPQGQSGQGQSQPTPAGGQGQTGQQGTGGQQQGGGFNWGLFPNVPEAQRELLQPHLQSVQGHVTQMEQQMAPYKGFMDAVPGDQVQGLLTFLNNYNQDPLETWLGMVEPFVQNGTIKAPGFSADSIRALLNGQAPGAMPPGVAQPGQQQGDQMPEWAQQIQSRFQQFDQSEQQRQQQAEAQQNEQLLTTAHAGMKEQLTAAGLNPQVVEGLTPEQLSAAIITHQGDVAAATQSFIQLRDSLLGNFVQQNGNGEKPALVAGELPNTPKPRGGKRDGFKDARVGAEQMLRQAQQQNAQ